MAEREPEKPGGHEDIADMSQKKRVQSTSELSNFVGPRIKRLKVIYRK